jgi:hypothetical protein
MFQPQWFITGKCASTDIIHMLCESQLIFNSLQHDFIFNHEKSNAIFSSIVCFRAQMQVRRAGTERWRQVDQDFKHMCGVQLFNATIRVLHSENSHRMHGIIHTQSLNIYVE